MVFSGAVNYVYRVNIRYGSCFTPAKPVNLLTETSFFETALQII